MKARWLALTLGALSLPSAAGAQPVEAGERVRVGTTAGTRFVGTFIEIRQGELGLRHDDGLDRINLASVRTIERSLGEQRRFVRNLLLTTGVGALTLGTLTAATWKGCTSVCDGPFSDVDPGVESFVFGFVVGGIVSTPIGLIVGLVVHSERWEPVTLLPAGASLILSPMGAGRVALGASFLVGPRRGSN